MEAFVTLKLATYKSIVIVFITAARNGSHANTASCHAQRGQSVTLRGGCSSRIPTKLWDKGWADPFSSYAEVAENKMSFSYREHTGEWTYMK